MAFIYLIASGRNIIKVGMATDVRQRVMELQIGTPFNLQVLHKIEVAAEYALKLEKLIHRRLKRYRMRGEWFRVEHDIAIRIAERAANQFAKDVTIANEEEDRTTLATLECRNCNHKGKAKVPVNAKHSLRCTKCGSSLVAWRL